MQQKSTFDRLKELKSLYDLGLITKEDFEAKTKQIEEEEKRRGEYKKRIIKIFIVVLVLLVVSIGVYIVHRLMQPTAQYVAQKAVIEAEITAVNQCNNRTDLYHVWYFYNVLSKHDRYRRDIAKKYLDNRPSYYYYINNNANEIKTALQYNGDLNNCYYYSLLDESWNDYFCIPDGNRTQRKPDTINRKERVIIDSLNTELLNKTAKKWKELNCYIYDYEVYLTNKTSKAVKYNTAYTNALINAVNRLKTCDDYDTFYTHFMIDNNFSGYLSRDEIMYGTIRTATNDIEKDMIYQETERWGDFIDTYYHNNRHCLMGSWQICSTGSTSYIDIKKTVLSKLPRNIKGFSITKDKFEIEVDNTEDDWVPITGIGRNLQLLGYIIDYLTKDSLIVIDKHGTKYRMAGDILWGTFTLDDQYVNQLNQVLRQGGDMTFRLDAGLDGITTFRINTDFYDNALARIGVDIETNDDNNNVQYTAIPKYINKSQKLRDNILSKNPSKSQQYEYEDSYVRYRIVKEYPDDNRHAFYYTIDSICAQCGYKGYDSHNVWLVYHDLETEAETKYNVTNYAQDYDFYGTKNSIVFVVHGYFNNVVYVFDFKNNSLRSYSPFKLKPNNDNYTNCELTNSKIDDIKRTITTYKLLWTECSWWSEKVLDSITCRLEDI